MANERVTSEDVYSLGWNSVRHDDPPFMVGRILSQQLHIIARLLLEVRGELEGLRAPRATLRVVEDALRDEGKTREADRLRALRKEIEDV